MDDKYLWDPQTHRVWQVDDLIAWGTALQTLDRKVAKENVLGLKISTIFLGLDHRLGGDGPPLLFETMVFREGDWTDLECQRYEHYEEALAGHSAIVQDVRDGRWQESSTTKQEERMQQTGKNLGHRKHRQAFGKVSVSKAQLQSMQRLANAEEERRRLLRAARKEKQFSSIGALMKDHRTKEEK